MSNEEKSICIIEFSGKKTDWDSWSKKFLLHGKQKGYKKLLVSTGSMPGMDKSLTQDEYEEALKGNKDLNEMMIVKLGELNELAYKDLTPPINTSSSIGKVAFVLVKNAKREDFLEENCKVAWNRLVSKYAPHTALSLLKMKHEFQKRKFESVDNAHDKWISHLEGLRLQMNEFSQKGSITDKDFIIHVLNNLLDCDSRYGDWG